MFFKQVYLIRKKGFFCLYVIVGLFLGPFFSLIAQEADEDIRILGSCQEYEFKYEEEGGKIMEGLLSRVINNEAEIYSCADTSDESCTAIKQLDFGTELKFLRYSDSPFAGRVEVKTLGAKKNVGWMDRNDMLCAKGPLKDENSISRRILVNTVNFEQEIPFYFQSDSESIDQESEICEDQCGTISPTQKGEFYFIVAEDIGNQRFLLKKDPDMKQPTIGWVDQELVDLWKGAQRPGSCLDFEFDHFVAKKTIVNDIISRVLSHNAKVYSCPKGDCTGVAPPTKDALSFNDRLRFLEFSESPREGRIKVRELGNRDALGWIERKDLLCATGPMKNENNVDRKLFINPKPAKIDDVQSTTAFRSPEEEVCLNNNCPQLSRFQLYYIVSEDRAKGRYLLKVDPRSQGQLVGWVNREEGIPWNTTLGIRPKTRVGLMYPPIYKVDSTQIKNMGSTSSQPSHPIWNHLSKNVGTYTHKALLDLLEPVLGTKPSFLQDYILKNTRHPNLTAKPPLEGQEENANFTQSNEQIKVKNEGGWYTRKKRLIILDTPVFKGRKFYHVIAPGVQSGFEENEEGFDELNLLSQIDVFFVLDGTEGMEPFIEGIQEVAQTIAEEFINEEGEDRSLRLGFRVFRDKFSGQKSCKKPNLEKIIGEGLKLTGGCRPNKEQIQANLIRFQEQISRVLTSQDPDCDEYTAEMFQGIDQALRDIESCSDNTKLLFVVGGHGDNDWRVSDDLVKKLVPEEKPIIISFLQTPDERKHFNHNKKGPAHGTYDLRGYGVGYNKFQEQAKDMLKRLANLTIQPLCEDDPVRCEKEKLKLLENLSEQILCVGDGKLCKQREGEAMTGEEFEKLFQKGLDDLPKKILKLVNAYSSTEAISFALTRSTGGMSLEEVIEQMEKEVEEKASYILTQQTLNLLGEENLTLQILNKLGSSVFKNRTYRNKTKFTEALNANINGLTEPQLQTILSFAKEEESLPVFLRTLYQSTCKEFQSQCKNRVDHRVFQAYIPVPVFGLTEKPWEEIIKANLSQEVLQKLQLLREKNFRNRVELRWKLEGILDKDRDKILIDRVMSSIVDDWQEELWISSEDLEKFSQLIKGLLGDYEDVEDQKADFSRLLVETFEALVGKPVHLKGQVLANFFEKRSTLPLRTQSPFMIYTPEEITRMEHCEFKELKTWVKESYALLFQVKESPRIEVATEEKPPTYDSSCPPIKPDHLIPVLVFDRGGKRFKNPKASYRHDLGDKVIFWLPKEFLP